MSGKGYLLSMVNVFGCVMGVVIVSEQAKGRGPIVRNLENTSRETKKSEARIVR